MTDKELLTETLNTIENEDIKEFAKNCLRNAPKYWFSVPASSGGKYHPKYALGDGGLLRHTVAVVKFLNYMLEIESIGNQFTPRQRDLLRTAAIVHDMYKSGTQEEYETSKWTKFDHPLIIAQRIRRMEGLNSDEREFCAMCVESHMGQWNSDKRHPDIILPKPDNKYRIILHLADYLASRKNIDVIFDDSKEETKPTPETWIVDFGKYKGMKLGDMVKQHPDYIVWLQDKGDFNREPCKSLLIEMGYKF